MKLILQFNKTSISLLIESDIPEDGSDSVWSDTVYLQIERYSSPVYLHTQCTEYQLNIINISLNTITIQ